MPFRPCVAIRRRHARCLALCGSRTSVAVSSSIIAREGRCPSLSLLVKALCRVSEPHCCVPMRASGYLALVDTLGRLVQANGLCVSSWFLSLRCCRRNLISRDFSTSPIYSLPSCSFPSTALIPLYTPPNVRCARLHDLHFLSAHPFHTQLGEHSLSWP